jgi:hypothetical protein
LKELDTKNHELIDKIEELSEQLKHTHKLEEDLHKADHDNK